MSGRQPGVGVRTQFVLQTFSSRLPRESSQGTTGGLCLLLTWQEGRLILLGRKAEQHARALGEAGATTGSIPALTLINAAGRNSGGWADAAAWGLMLHWLKFYQVLKTAGAHKAKLKSFLSESKSAFLEDHRDRIID